MVPVILLQVEPHHRVLDLCAAPGSKTTQVLEALYSSRCLYSINFHLLYDSHTAGMVIANYSNARRAYILASRCKSLGECSQYLMVTNHKAQYFPNVNIPLNSTEEGRYPSGIYDRIVCDVPCSGDGAIRKAPDVWHSFHPENGIRLHSIQLQIALRAAALLKEGGLMAYSTCSFNPIENEAVIAELLTRFESFAIY